AAGSASRWSGLSYGSNQFGMGFAIHGCRALPCSNNPEEEAMAGMEWPRRLPVWAEVLPDHGVHFRVWAPRRQRVAVVLEGGTDYRLDNYALAVQLMPEGNGYFSGQVAHAQAGTLYRYRLDDSDTLFPDPASRFQPQGPH